MNSFHWMTLQITEEYVKFNSVLLKEVGESDSAYSVLLKEVGESDSAYSLLLK